MGTLAEGTYRVSLPIHTYTHTHIITKHKHVVAGMRGEELQETERASRRVWKCVAPSMPRTCVCVCACVCVCVCVCVCMCQ